jgi:hypothetical protein
VEVVGIRLRNEVIRELAVGVEWGCRLGGRIGCFGFERRSGGGRRWKYAGNRGTWHVLWRLASQRLLRMMGQWDKLWCMIC